MQSQSGSQSGWLTSALEAAASRSPQDYHSLCVTPINGVPVKTIPIQSPTVIIQRQQLGIPYYYTVYNLIVIILLSRLHYEVPLADPEMYGRSASAGMTPRHSQTIINHFKEKWVPRLR